MDALDPAKRLKQQIQSALDELGLEVGEDLNLTLNELQDTLSFNLNVLPGALIKPEDFDQIEYDKVFREITDQL